jgi:hypothetical protein
MRSTLTKPVVPSSARTSSHFRIVVFFVGIFFSFTAVSEPPTTEAFSAVKVAAALVLLGSIDNARREAKEGASGALFGTLLTTIFPAWRRV